MRILFLLLISFSSFGQLLNNNMMLKSSRDSVEIPYPFFANSVDKDSIRCEWIDIGADTYVLQSDDNDDFSSPTTEYTGSNTSYTLTGLSANTKLYFRLKAQTAGLSDSRYAIDSATTFPFTPIAYYDFRGLDSVTNDYADNATVGTYNYVKSVINYSGPTLTTVSTLGSIIYGARVRWSGFTQYSHNQLHTPSTSYTFSGDFEINWQITFSNTPNNSSILFNSANTQRIRMVSLSSVQFGTNSAISLTNALELNKKYWLTFQRSGSTFTIIVRDNEGTITSNSGTVATTSVTFDRVFFASALFRSSCLFMMDRVLTSDERLAGQNRVKRPPVESTPVPDSGIIVKGVTFSPFTGPYLVNTNFDFSVSGGMQRNSFYGYEDYQFALTNTLRPSPNYGEDLLYVFKGNNEVSNSIPLGVPSTIVDAHNIGSIAIWNNSIVQFEQNIHYDKGRFNSLVVKVFGKDFNLINYKKIPLGRGIAASTGGNLQYHQAFILNNKIYVIAQEWDGSSGNTARRVVMLISDDGWNAFEKKYQLIESDDGDGDFLYPITAYSEDQLLIAVEHRLQPEDESRAIYVFKIDPATETTVRSIDGLWTKNIATSPVTVTEAETNLLMGTAYSTTTAVKEGSMLYNPATEIAHCVRANGTEDGLTLAIIDVGSGTITEKAIPEVIDGHDLDVDFSTEASLSNNTPFVYTEGSDMYLVAGEDNGGNTKIIRCVSSDGGDNWDFYDQITTDDTKKHTRFMPTKNWYYTTNRKIFASKIQSTYADLFVYTVAP